MLRFVWQSDDEPDEFLTAPSCPQPEPEPENDMLEELIRRHPEWLGKVKVY